MSSLPDFTPIPLTGSPADLGRRHGLLFPREIRLLRRAFFRFLLRAGYLVAAWPLALLFYVLGGRFWPQVPPALKEEMRALAAAADLDLASVLLINVLDDVANALPRCSAVAVTPPRSATGGVLVGRNLDYPLFIDVLVRQQRVFLVTPEGGVPFLSVAWPGYVGVCTGMNRRGVVLCQLTAVCRRATFRGVPAALRFRLALERGESLTAAARELLALPATIGNNVLVADASGALVLELAPGAWACRRPLAGLLTATNHFQAPEMANLKGRFPRRPPGSPLSPEHFSEAYSLARDRRLRELAEGKLLMPQDLMKILADPQVANPGTVVSAVFSPPEGTLWLAQGESAPVSRHCWLPVRVW
ncbi:MAG: C45 family peptidase [Desulfobaccales bacterium]